MNTLDEITNFECICHSPEHTLKVEYDADMKNLVFSVHLNQYRNIFKRIWTGIKYIFGYKCKFGQWDIFEMQNQDIPKFKRILELIEKTNNDLPNYFILNGEYLFFKDKQELINKVSNV
jgi:hypothetical protein